jgi:hypothetical protein
MSRISSDSSTDKIWIRFPSFYDPYLSIYPLFVTSPQLKGALNIEIWNKDVIIWGFYTMKLRTNITLSIWGVINPNKIPDVNITGFQMGLLTSANRTRFMTGLFGNFVLDPAPDIIEILSLANKIPYARYDDNYTMEINSHIPIKDSSQGGQLKVMFPDDFYMDVFNGVCATEDRYSLYSVCSQFYNTYLFNSANKLFDFKTKGSLTVKINNHRNAEYDGLTGSVIVYNYDKSTRQVLSRSYGTLSKSYLNFTYDGLQLFANNGQPYTLEVGSLSDPIPIGAVEAMKQRLTVVPLYFDSNFVFANVPVTLVPGSTGSFIRIAAPQTMLRKKFYITFSKSGDIISKFYAPIPKFPVIITKGSLMRNVIPYNTLYVNRGGISIPLYVDINNPPYDNVAVTLTITNPSASLITMNTTSLVFGKSSSRLYYLITGVSDTFTDSAINMQFTLSGTDASSFQVTTPLVSIPVNPPDPDPAPFIEYRIDQNNRGNINIYVKSSKLAYVYCAAGYQYMPEPTYEMVKGKNLTANIYGYSKPLYAEGYLDTTNFEGIIQMTGLTPSVQYTLYCYTMNLNGVPSATYNKLNFQNTPAQRIATFTMKVNQGIVSQELRDEYVKRLATLMDIQSSRVFEKLFCKSEPPIGSEPDTTYITYYVMPDPLNNDDDISPINMVRGLNKRRSDITKFVPKLDPGNLLVMKELKENPPTFKSRPTMDRRGTSWITINATVSSCGYLMVAAQPINGTRWLLSTNATLFFFENQVIKNLYPKEKEFYPYGIENALGETNIFSLYGGPNYKPTTGTRRMLKVIEYTPLTLQERYPTAFQMNRSLNQTNLPEKHSYSIEVDDTTKTWTVNATGLRDNIIHNIYVSAVSDKPIYPDYMDPRLRSAGQPEDRQAET